MTTEPQTLPHGPDETDLLLLDGGNHAIEVRDVRHRDGVVFFTVADAGVRIAVPHHRLHEVVIGKGRDIVGIAEKAKAAAEQAASEQ